MLPANNVGSRPRLPAVAVCAVLAALAASLIAVSFWLPGPEADNTGTGDEIVTAVTPSRTAGS